MRKPSRLVASRKAAGERLARRERHRVHDDVELAPLALQQVERGIDLRVDRDVERHRQLRAQGVRERLDALLHLVVHVGEGELRALAMHRLGDAPGDRAVGRDADDEGALASEKSHDWSSGADYAGKPRARDAPGDALSRGGRRAGCAASGRASGAGPSSCRSRRRICGTLHWNRLGNLRDACRPRARCRPPAPRRVVRGAPWCRWTA